MPIYRGADVNRKTAYTKLAGALRAERSAGFDDHWRELGNHFMPRRTRFWSGDRNRGDRRNQNIIDSTGRFAARTLASGLHAGLTSPARPWMKLTTPDPDLAKFGPVKTWLYDVTQRMLTIFAVTNLYNVLPTVYGDLGIFGTACMAILEDSRDLFRCYAYPIGSYALGQDARGLVTTFVRELELTVRQVVESYGVQENGRDIDWTPISQSVKDQWENSDYENPVKVTWIVKPNEQVNRKRPEARYLPWTSCHWETGADTGTFLRESGFNVFPLMAPRWDVTGEDTYGTDCPGMTALPDTKQLQIMQRTKGKLLIKAVDPPLAGPAELRQQKTSLLPGDITYVNVREGMQGLKPIHEVRLEGFQHLTADMREVQYRIQRAFYEDLFLMLATSDNARESSAPVTAREIDERHEEKLLALGPVLERTGDELLDPIVDRVFDMMDRAGLIPPEPPELRGVKLKVEYISILAQAQKLVGVASQDRLVASVGAMIEAFPDVRYKMNTNRLVDNYSEMLGNDPDVVRSDADADALKHADQQAMADQAAAEQAQKLAQAAKAAGQTPLTGDTALNRIVQSAANASAQPATV